MGSAEVSTSLQNHRSVNKLDPDYIPKEFGKGAI